MSNPADESTPCYVARYRDECQCIVAAIIDDPAMRRELVQFFQDAVDHGNVIERTTAAVVRTQFGCRQCENCAERPTAYEVLHNADERAREWAQGFIAGRAYEREHGGKE